MLDIFIKIYFLSTVITFITTMFIRNIPHNYKGSELYKKFSKAEILIICLFPIINTFQAIKDLLVIFLSPITDRILIYLEKLEKKLDDEIENEK